MTGISTFIFGLITLSATITFGQNSILWEVSGNGLTKSSYLLGTLKFIGEKEYVLHSVISEKLKECELFAIEDEVDHHAQHELNKALHFPKGESLATVLSEDDYQKVESFFSSEFGIPKSKFKKHYARLKPLALSITMTRLALHEGVKFYDIELLKMAKDLGLETFSLEPVSREAEAFNAFAIADQSAALLHSIQHFNTQKSEYEKMEEAYVEGDIDLVFEYSLHPYENNETFINEFYYKRNIEWLPKLEKMFSDKKSFVTVGVTHMEGDQGLITLLKQKGYTVTPIPVKP